MGTEGWGGGSRRRLDCGAAGIEEVCGWGRGRLEAEGCTGTGTAGGTRDRGGTMSEGDGGDVNGGETINMGSIGH